MSILIWGNKESMKKFLIVLSLFLIIYEPCFAGGAGYRYIDGGGIYSEVTVPLDLPNAKYNQSNDKILPISSKAVDNKIDIKTLKTAQSSTVNVLGLVDVGDAGIYETARKGRISTIHYIEYTNEKVYVPFIFIPIYFKRYITTIYGE
ncbi:MAG: TRL domain-containing protein [Candidatus Gastranaerophilales bacterium]|nr:TRL domain-containing protein [Candidatus Gastranaerophilales bacterium]